MAFYESPRLDKCYAFGSVGGPGFSNEIAEVASGFEYVNVLWSQARRRYTISYNAKRPEAFDILLAQFLAVGGMAGRFRMKDPNDFCATSTQGVVSQLTSLTFQMYKRYTWGSQTHNRKIQKPTNNSTVQVIGGVTPTVDYTTGIITVASGTPTGWYGDFDVPVRFNTDLMRATVLNKSLARGLITAWDDIELIEVRL